MSEKFALYFAGGVVLLTCVYLLAQFVIAIISGSYYDL